MSASCLGCSALTRVCLRVQWDAEQSGGNRDVLCNGAVLLPDGGSHVVEIQLHLRPMYELKHDLHKLYMGVRILGSMDTAMVVHEGDLTEAVVSNASKGVVRRLRCSHTPMRHAEENVVGGGGGVGGTGATPLFSGTPGMLATPQMVAWLVQRHMCPLLELSLTKSFIESAEAPAFTGWSIGGLLLLPAAAGAGLVAGGLVAPNVQQLQCTRLQVLKLSGCGLSGPIPPQLGECASLRRLLLNNNALGGSIPPTFGKLGQLKDLFLRNCKLEGPVPSELSGCVSLAKLKLSSNRLSGRVPVDALVALSGSLQLLDLDENEALELDDEGRQQLQAALRKECKLTMPSP